MMTDAMALFTMAAAKNAVEAEKEPVVAEPEFKPFRFPAPEAAAVHAEALRPANTAREPRTLGELGVPGTLAREIEAAFRLVGATQGDRVTGFTFRTADGTRYALKTAPTGTPAREAGEVAA